MRTRHSLSIEENNKFMETFLPLNKRERSTLRKSAQNVIDYYSGTKSLDNGIEFKTFMSKYYRNSANYEAAIREVDNPSYNEDDYNNLEFRKHIKYHNLLVAQFIVKIYEKFDDSTGNFEKLSDVFFDACGERDYYDDYYDNSIDVDTIVNTIKTNSKYFNDTKFTIMVNNKYIDDLLTQLDAWIGSLTGTLGDKVTFKIDFLNVLNNVKIEDMGVESYDLVEFKSTFNIILFKDSSEYSNEEPSNRVELKDKIKEIMRGE